MTVNYRNTATLDDIFRLALPSGAALLTGESFLDRPVSWASTLRPSPPAFPKLDGGELALVDMADLRILDPEMRLDRLILRLQQANISAMAVIGDFQENAIQAAQQANLPLFRLPAATQAVRVERAIIRLIVDRDGYVAQRSADLQRELTQIALDSNGLEGIARRITQFTQQPLILMRDDGTVAALSGLEQVSDARRRQILASLPNGPTLRSWAARQSGPDLAEAVGILDLVGSGDVGTYRQTAVAAIVAGEGVRGYALLLRTDKESRELSAVEMMAVSQGAAAAALEWVKQNAVGVAEERMRAAFVDELLAAEIADEQAWIQRGGSLGYDLHRPHVAILLEAQGVANWPTPLLRFIQEQEVSPPSTRREEGMLIFWPTDSAKSGRELKIIAHSFVERILATHPKAQLVIGIGRPAAGPALWLQSLQQARESWRLGREWQGGPVTYFGDLGLYQLLTALRTSPEAARLFRKTLGQLVSHDDNRNAELVDTLEAFFECHGNLSQTAARLHIHRNTLTYRLERISAITRLDLNDPDARFALQLALKLRPVLK